MNPQSSSEVTISIEENRIENPSANPNPAATTGEHANPNPAATTGEHAYLLSAEEKEVVEEMEEREDMDMRLNVRSPAATTGERANPNPAATTFRRLLNPNGKNSLVWSAVLILICGFAVSADPLFLYIPIVNIDIKCARLDRKLLVTALFLRFLTDIFYSYDIIWNVLEDRFNRWRIIKQRLLIVVLAVAPVPQVVIFRFANIIRLPSSPRIILNSLLVLQYVVRVRQIYQLRKKLEKHITQDTPIKWFKGVGKFWIRGAFIIFEFILASHVFGALWYFFSFQRVMDCWKYACRNENGCELGDFDCKDKDTFMRNVTLLNNLCHANPPTATSFNFGIFLDAIQSGILSSTDFPQKFLHCFWWGLRNLSSFGQSLQTSSYAWEDLFAVVINVIGMLFVLIYLSAIVQMHAQVTTELAREMEMEMSRVPQIAIWLDDNGLPLYLKNKILTGASKELREDEDVNIINICRILPWKDVVNIMRHLCLDTLKKVMVGDHGLLDKMDGKMFEGFCVHLQPVIYEADTFITRQGELYDKMLFITQGTVRTYITGAGNSHGDIGYIQKGDFYGEPVEAWLSGRTTFRSTKNLKCVTKVEGFTITIENMKKIFEEI